MKKKILSFLVAICLLIPSIFMLTACGNNGGNNNGGNNNGGENPSVITYSDYFNGIKVVENMSFEDMSETGEAYLFTKAVMEQIDTLATELLLRFCGHYGLGLTVELAESYGIAIAEDIVTEATAKRVIHRDAWDWDHVRDFENILTDPNDPALYIEVYFNAYPSVNKENYKDKLILSLYKLLVDITPANLETATLREAAKKFDHLGFYESEVQKITNFVLSKIIGELNLEEDLLRYNEDYNRYGYFNYAEVVPQLVLDSVNRKVENEPVYPLLSMFQFSEKTVESFGVNETGDNYLCGSAGQYRSVIFDAKKACDITAFTIVFEVPESEISTNVQIKITSKYQFYNAETESYEVVRATLGIATITPGTYNKNTETTPITVSFKIAPFTNNTNLDNEQPYIVGQNDTLNYGNYFENYDNGNGYNLEYADNNTPFLQLFFEVQGSNKNINFKFAFKDINITENK